MYAVPVDLNNLLVTKTCIHNFILLRRSRIEFYSVSGRLSLVRKYLESTIYRNSSQKDWEN